MVVDAMRITSVNVLAMPYARMMMTWATAPTGPQRTEGGHTAHRNSCERGCARRGEGGPRRRRRTSSGMTQKVGLEL